MTLPARRRRALPLFREILANVTIPASNFVHSRQPKDRLSFMRHGRKEIPVEVPALIDQITFDAVQAHLRSRNPKVTPARVVSGPTLLTGICFCAKCAGAMTLRTGKGRADARWSA